MYPSTVSSLRNATIYTFISKRQKRTHREIWRYVHNSTKVTLLSVSGDSAVYAAGTERVLVKLKGNRTLNLQRLIILHVIEENGSASAKLVGVHTGAAVNSVYVNKLLHFRGYVYICGRALDLLRRAPGANAPQPFQTPDVTSFRSATFVAKFNATLAPMWKLQDPKGTLLDSCTDISISPDGIALLTIVTQHFYVRPANKFNKFTAVFKLHTGKGEPFWKTLLNDTLVQNMLPRETIPAAAPSSTPSSAPNPSPSPTSAQSSSSPPPLASPSAAIAAAGPSVAAISLSGAQIYAYDANVYATAVVGGFRRPGNAGTATKAVILAKLSYGRGTPLWMRETSHKVPPDNALSFGISTGLVIGSDDYIYMHTVYRNPVSLQYQSIVSRVSIFGKHDPNNDISQPLAQFKDLAHRPVGLAYSRMEGVIVSLPQEKSAVAKKGNIPSTKLLVASISPLNNTRAGTLCFACNGPQFLRMCLTLVNKNLGQLSLSQIEEVLTERLTLLPFQTRNATEVKVVKTSTQESAPFCMLLQGTNLRKIQSSVEKKVPDIFKRPSGAQSRNILEKHFQMPPVTIIMQKGSLKVVAKGSTISPPKNGNSGNEIGAHQDTSALWVRYGTIIGIGVFALVLMAVGLAFLYRRIQRRDVPPPAQN